MLRNDGEAQRNSPLLLPTAHGDYSGERRASQIKGNASISIVTQSITEYRCSINGTRHRWAANALAQYGRTCVRSVCPTSVLRWPLDSFQTVSSNHSQSAVRPTQIEWLLEACGTVARPSIASSAAPLVSTQPNSEWMLIRCVEMPPAERANSLRRAGWPPLCSPPSSWPATSCGWTCPCGLTTWRSRRRSRSRRRRSGAGAAVAMTTDRRTHGPRRHAASLRETEAPPPTPTPPQHLQRLTEGKLRSPMLRTSAPPQPFTCYFPLLPVISGTLLRPWFLLSAVYTSSIPDISADAFACFYSEEWLKALKLCSWSILL